MCLMSAELRTTYPQLSVACITSGEGQRHEQGSLLETVNLYFSMCSVRGIY